MDEIASEGGKTIRAAFCHFGEISKNDVFALKGGRINIASFKLKKSQKKVLNSLSVIS